MMIHGGKLLCSPKKRKVVREKNRVCRQAGCDTILSQYNDTSWCAAHITVIPGDSYEDVVVKKRQNAPRTRGGRQG